MQSMHPYKNGIGTQPSEQSPPVNKDRFFSSEGRSLFASLTVYMCMIDGAHIPLKLEVVLALNTELA